ncbi:MAG: D-cysteine desulfhydrase family protein [Tepidisphaeraceae bacterium]
MHPAEPTRVSLANLPTPIVDASRLAPNLLVKRDDLTGLEMTGNKVRKLEYVVADAIAKGADTLVTHGGFQSNHCRATAAAGAKLGLNVRLFLRSADANPAHDGNLFLDHLLGADVSLHSVEQYNDRKPLTESILNEQRAKGRSPYFFPVGASVPVGCWGYIRCMHELATQLGRDRLVDLFVPVSSSGTMAGCVLGRALFGLTDFRIVGIPVSDTIQFFQSDLRKLIDDTIAAFDLKLTHEQTPIELLDGSIGAGYAVPFPEAIETIRLAATQAGLLLDPTYTGKAMHGTLTAIRAGKVRAGATPVFLHTGGVFGLLARRELFA